MPPLGYPVTIIKDLFQNAAEGPLRRRKQGSRAVKGKPRFLSWEFGFYDREDAQNYHGDDNYNDNIHSKSPQANDGLDVTAAMNYIRPLHPQQVRAYKCQSQRYFNVATPGPVPSGALTGCPSWFFIDFFDFLLCMS